MSMILPETGFLGFFDILGYTQIILNNNIHKTAQFVSDTLVNIPHDINQALLTRDAPNGNGESNGESREWEAMLDKVKWVVFSDSILLSMPFDPHGDTIYILHHYLAFATVCASLLNRTFRAGFPIRGAISVGEFFIEDRCFAGRPIISAYALAQALELSGCVLDEEANALVSSLRREIVRGGEESLRTILDQTTILYLMPMKNDIDQRHRSINWVYLDVPGFEPLHGEAREMVTRSFLMHNKIAVPAVQGKITNTEMFIRHVQTNLAAEAVS
jgi:hypothetical protein